jgi:WD40 repeat protein
MARKALGARLADLLIRVTKRSDTPDLSSEIIDWGLVTTTSPKKKRIEVEVSVPSIVTTSLDGLTVTPDRLPNAGRYTLEAELDPARLYSGVLLEGELLIKSNDRELRLRVTGTVDETGIMSTPSSIAMHQKPWSLIRRLKGHRQRVRALAFLPDSRMLISGGDDCTVRTWNLEESRESRDSEEFEAEIWSLATSWNGRLLAVGLRNGMISLRDSVTLREVWHSQIHQGMISGLAFSPDSSFLVAGSGDRTFSVTDTTTGSPLYEPVHQKGIITSIALSGNGLMLASTSQTRRVFLWEARTGAFLRELVGHTSNVWDIAFSLDGYLLVSGSGDRSVRVWDTQTGETVSQLDGFGHQVTCVTISPDGTMVATASAEPKVRVWSTKSERRLANLESNQQLLEDLIFSPDQTLLVGGLHDGQVYVWAAHRGVSI